MVAEARCWSCGGVKIPNGTTKGEPRCECDAPSNSILSKCDTPECRAYADERLVMSGDFGQLSGNFCLSHSNHLKRMLSTRTVRITLLHPIRVQDTRDLVGA